MLDGDLFDTIEFLARRIRRVNRPFGGMQVILAGDFLQLPPVQEHTVSTASAAPRFSPAGSRLPPDARAKGAGVTPSRAAARTDVKFCFEARTWNDIVYASVVLRRVFRQRDMAFVSLLNELRVGHVSPRAASLLATSGAEVKDMLVSVAACSWAGVVCSNRWESLSCYAETGTQALEAVRRQPGRRQNQRIVTQGLPRRNCRVRYCCTALTRLSWCFIRVSCRLFTSAPPASVVFSP
jgi:hypothetical protein